MAYWIGSGYDLQSRRATELPSVNLYPLYSAFAPVGSILQAQLVPLERSKRYFRDQSWVSVGVLPYAVTPVQLALPIADVSGSWTQPDLVTTTNLFAQIGEVTPDDTTYVQSPQDPVNSEEKFRLASLQPPVTRSGHVIHWRYGKTLAAGFHIALTVNLYHADGVTLIATRAFSDVSAGVTAGDIPLTLAEAATITPSDYANGLVIGFSANYSP